MPDAAPFSRHAFRPGERVEARRRTPVGVVWSRAVVVARAPFGYLTRFPDGVELPRSLVEVRASAPVPPLFRPRPSVGERVLFSPYDDTPGTCLRRRFDERATLIADQGDTVTVVVAGNSVRQHAAAQANPDGVRRVTVPAHQILPDVPLIGRAVLVDARQVSGPRYKRGTVVKDGGNTVTVCEDGRSDWNGHQIVGLNRVHTLHGRPLPDALRDEAAGCEAWEVDFRPDLCHETRHTLTRAAARFDAWGGGEAIRAMIAFPSLDLVLSPTVELERLRRHLDEMERPTIDLSVKGVTATVTVTRRNDVWGYQFQCGYCCGSGMSRMVPADKFTGAFPTKVEALRAAFDALGCYAAPEGFVFPVKAQQAAAARLLKRITAARAAITIDVS